LNHPYFFTNSSGSYYGRGNNYIYNIRDIILKI
jgi:hypothetical protein